MREPNLKDNRLTVRPSLAAKKKLAAIARRLKVSSTRILEQLIENAPADLSLTSMTEDKPANKKKK